MKANSRILIVPDMHQPYSHPDVVAFLSAVKKKYRPDRVICLGDEIDGHSISFHEHSPELMGPSDELQLAIKRLKPIYKLFPVVDVLESNHGSLVYRKATAHGLPRRVFRSYREILEAPPGWKWHPDLMVKPSSGSPIYLCHGKSSDVLRLSQAMGMSVIQGHFHERFEVRYWGNPIGLYWGMTAGCLINNKSLAFAYNKVNIKRPLIGCAMILDGLPLMIPLVMKPGGRWTGDLL